MPAPARVRSVAAARLRNFSKRRGSRSRPSSNWPRRMEQNSRDGSVRERAARERQQRIEEAMRECDELQKQREAAAKQSGRKVTEARASTTEPEARNMKFPDGGYRPGYNFQFATDTASGVIAGVEVTNAGATTSPHARSVR